MGVETGGEVCYGKRVRIACKMTCNNNNFEVRSYLDIPCISHRGLEHRFQNMVFLFLFIFFSIFHILYQIFESIVFDWLKCVT